MPLNDKAINEILPFCPNGIESNDVHGDLLDLVSYANILERKRGHQPGIAKRAVENRALRQALHVVVGVSQFIANRYPDGVKDDGNVDKVEDGLAEAIKFLINGGVEEPDPEPEPEDPDELINKIIAAGLIMPGMCMPWTGTFYNNKYPINPVTGKYIPKWHICDGTDGTPDFRDKFIIGASSTVAAGSAGGSKTHKHTANGSGNVGSTTLSTSQMPSHSHSYTKAAGNIPADGGPHMYNYGTASASSGSAGGGSSHTHSLSGLAIDVGNADVLPPYYALAWITRMA